MTSDRRGLSPFGVVLATVAALVVVIGVGSVLSQPGAVGRNAGSFLLVVTAGVVVGVLSKLLGVFGSEGSRRARQRLAFWVNVVAAIALVLAGLFGYLTGGLKTPAAPFQYPVALAAGAAAGVLLGHFVLGSAIVVIRNGLPRLVSGRFARDWWGKRTARTAGKSDPGGKPDAHV